MENLKLRKPMFVAQNNQQSFVERLLAPFPQTKIIMKSIIILIMIIKMKSEITDSIGLPSAKTTTLPVLLHR